MTAATPRPGLEAGLPNPDAEHARLESLAGYEILDTESEDSFDEIADLAARLLGAPIALVSLVDAERQWFKARVGLEVSETPRSESFCAWSITETPKGEVFVVNDAAKDHRFAENPLVVGSPGIRFYAGAPIRSPGGHVLGTVCVIDTVPRPDLDAAGHDTLCMLARTVSHLLELRRVARELAAADARSRALIDNASDIILVLKADGTVSFVNRVAEEVLGWSAQSVLGTNALDLLHPDDFELVVAAFGDTSETPGLNVPFEFTVAHADGSWVPVEAVANNLLDDADVRGIVVHIRDVRHRKAVEKRLQSGERALLAAQQLAKMGSWEWDLVTGDMVWSTGLFQLLGVDPRTVEPTEAAWRATFHPDERDRISDDIAEARKTGEPFSYRRRVVQPSGQVRIVQAHGEFDRSPDGAIVRMLGTAVDVTDAATTEQALGEERQFLHAVLDSLDEGIVACDADGRLSLFNRTTERFHGLPATETPTGEWADHYNLYAADGETPLPTESIPLLRAFNLGSVVGDEIVIAPVRGQRRLVRCNGQAIVDADGVRIGAVVAMQDITRQKRAEATLRHLAEHDVLTDLPNRSVFSNRLDAALATTNDIAVLFIDLDDFKRINDEYGHNVGDQVLVTTASRIRAALKEGDTAARIGGDEFVVLCVDVITPSMVETIVRRLQSVLAEPIMIQGVLLQSGASIGFALPDPGAPQDGEALLVRADHAMYANKAARRT